MFGRRVAILLFSLIISCIDPQAWAESVTPHPATKSSFKTYHHPHPRILDGFGMSIAADGAQLLVGAPYAKHGGQDTGQAFVFNSEGMLVRTINIPVIVPDALFGQSVTFSSDSIIIGAPLARDALNAQRGAVYIFARKTGELRLTLQNPGIGRGAFGHTVSAHDHQILVGDPQARSDGSWGSGAAYLFDEPTGELIRTIRANTSKSRRSSQFGHALQITAKHILVSDPSGVSRGIGGGVVYLYHRKTGELERTFVPSNPTDSLLFGWDFSANERIILVGAMGFQGVHREEGIAYVFDLLTGRLLNTYKDPTPSDQGRFGKSVALVAEQVFVAAPGDHVRPSGKIEGGAIYVIDQDSGEVLQHFQEPHPLAGASDLYGESLATHQETLYVGAPFGGVSEELDAGIVFRFHVKIP